MLLDFKIIISCGREWSQYISICSLLLYSKRGFVIFLKSLVVILSDLHHYFHISIMGLNCDFFSLFFSFIKLCSWLRSHYLFTDQMHLIMFWIPFSPIAAMLAYKTVSGTKNFKKVVHLSVQFLALFLSLIGLWAAIKFHNERGIDNFYSLHSWFGLASIILFGIQVCIYWTWRFK